MNQTNKIPEWKLLNGIRWLLVEADTSLRITELFQSIKEPAPGTTSVEYEFIRFSANNWFNQAINILHTVLFGYKDTKTRIQQEFTLPDDWNPELKKIKSNPFLKRIRNTAINHKNLFLEQPDWWLNNKINEEVINTTRQIINETIDYLFNRYNYSCKSITKDQILDWFNSIIRSVNLTTKSF